MARPRQTPRLHRLPQRLDYTLIPAPLDLSLPLMTEKSPLPAIIVTPSSPSSTHDFSIAFLAPPPKPPLRSRLAALFPSSSAISLPSSPSATSAPSLPLLPSTYADSDSTPVEQGRTARAFGPNSSTKKAGVLRARAVVIALLVLFVCACHAIAHRLAARRPHLAFAMHTQAFERTVGAAYDSLPLATHPALSSAAFPDADPSTSTIADASRAAEPEKLSFANWFGFRGLWAAEQGPEGGEREFIVLVDDSGAVPHSGDADNQRRGASDAHSGARRRRSRAA